MTSMNISLPENLKIFVDMQVDTGEYSTSSEYVRDLIRADRNKKLGIRLSMLLAEGIESGQPIIADSAYWDNKFTSLTSES